MLVGSNGMGFYMLIKVHRHTVVFESNSGIYVKNQTVNNRCFLEYVESDKLGFTFDGWYYDNKLTKEFKFTDHITNSMYLYAKWKECKLITLNVNGSVYNVTNNNDKMIIPDDISIYDGYIFDQWYTNIELTQVYDFNISDEEINLYASFYKVGENIFKHESIDVSAYVRYTDGKLYESEDNRCSVVSLNASTDYVVSIIMEKRFRIAFGSSDNFTLPSKLYDMIYHKNDQNNDEITNKYSTIPFMTQNKYLYVYIFYWTQPTTTKPDTIKNTIKLFQRTDTLLHYSLSN